MQGMKLISGLVVVAMMSLLLSVKVSPEVLVIMKAYASTNATGNNQTEDDPVLVFPPPSLLSSDLASNPDANRTNVTQEPSAGNYTNGTALGTEGPRQIIQSKPSGNYANGTALGTEGPRQIIIGKPTGLQSQLTPQGPAGQHTPSGNEVLRIPNINITKEQAAKAEQEANIMIKAYYDKQEQEKQIQKEKEEAALAAAAQTNQTIESTGQAGGLQNDDAAASADETDIDVEDEEQGDGETEEDEENDDSEDGDNEQDDD